MSVIPAAVGSALVPRPALDEAQRLYLDLLKKCLTRLLGGGEDWQPFEPIPQVDDPAKRRGIRPMGIVEHQDQRRLRSQVGREPVQPMQDRVAPCPRWRAPERPVRQRRGREASRP